MAIKGNIGEWSEFYTLIKLLGDGVLYAGDENMEQIKDLFYPIIMILRQEANNKLNYVRNANETISIETPEGDILLSVPTKSSLKKRRNCCKR